MKKILIIMLSITMLFATSAFVACKVEDSGSHVHKGGVATCNEKAKCDECGEEYGEFNPENHTSTELVYVSNGNGTHKIVHKCCNAVTQAEEICAGGEATCKEKAKCEKCGGEYGELGEHTGGTPTCNQKAVCSDCGKEYGDFDATHHASEEFIYTANNNGTHNKIRKCCNVVAVENEKCSGGTATCQSKATCKDCGAEYGNLGAHNYTKVGKDAESHWKECSVCNTRDENSVTAHSATVWETTENGEIGKCECGETVTTIIESVPANEINLYTIANLGGNDYSIEETYSPVVTVNGVSLTINVSSGDENVAIYEDGKIKAVKAGKAIITVTYTLPSNRGEVTKTFEVNVNRPVITDETAVNYFSAIDGWHAYLTELFGENAITEAKQTYKGEEYALTYADGKLSGMFTESKTSTVCSLTLYTETYGYVLSNVTAYTKVINTAADLEDMRLTADRKTVKGYFIMNADLDYSKIDFNGDNQYTYYDNLYPYFNLSAKAPTDMLTEDVAKPDNTPNKAAGFVGVFDGNGHKIIGYRAGNSYGFFGTISGSGLSDLTVIKNVAFTDITAEASSWTIGRVFAHYATCVSVENVYISFAKGIESWTKNFSLFGAKESVYFRFNKVVIEYPATSASAASQGETACVGFFSTVGTTAFYGRKRPNDQWHWQMKTVYQNLYIVAPKATNGRVHALNMSNQIIVYAANDFADFAEAAKASLDETTLNPVANDSGTIEVFHWKNAYRYDTLAAMAEANSKVGNWKISASGVVWEA